MKYFILCIITVVGINAFSQTLKLKVQDKSIELKSSSSNLPVNNIVELIKDKNQNDILIFANYIGEMGIKEGYYKGQKTGGFKEGLVFKDGSKYEFPEKETFLCNIEDRVYSIQTDFLKTQRYINVYHINGFNLTKASNSIVIPFTNTFERIPNSEFFILSNFDENAGNAVNIYDKNLNIITIYKPYENGFSSMIYTSIGENIFIISTPFAGYNLNEQYKVTTINTHNNFSVHEINYVDKVQPIKVFSFENNFIIISVGKIIFFNKHGELLWSKNLNIASSIFSPCYSKSENKIFMMAEGSIICIDASEGKEFWRISLEDIIPNFEKSKSIKNEYQMTLGPIDFKIFPSLGLIGVLSAKIEQTIKDNSITYSNKNLTLIDKGGKIVKYIPLPSIVKNSIPSTNSQGRVKTSLLIVEDNGFRIINDRKIEKYEK